MKLDLCITMNKNNSRWFIDLNGKLKPQNFQHKMQAFIFIVAYEHKNNNQKRKK